jgi:hypothetical protein
MPSDITAFQDAYDKFQDGNCNLDKRYKKGDTCFPLTEQLITAYTKMITDLKTTKYGDVSTSYEQNLKLRNDLTTKMHELNKNPDSLYGEQQSMHDSAIYVNILSTVLATTLLYYVFVKLE